MGVGWTNYIKSGSFAQGLANKLLHYGMVVADSNYANTNTYGVGIYPPSADLPDGIYSITVSAFDGTLGNQNDVFYGILVNFGNTTYINAIYNNGYKVYQSGVTNNNTQSNQDNRCHLAANNGAVNGGNVQINASISCIMPVTFGNFTN